MDHLGRGGVYTTNDLLMFIGAELPVGGLLTSNRAINVEWIFLVFFFFSAGQGGFRETFASFCNIDNLVGERKTQTRFANTFSWWGLLVE